MQYILLKLDPYNEYTTTFYDGETIGFLEAFLKDTPLGDVQFYRDWALKGANAYQATGQLAYLHKQHNSIFIGSLFSPKPEEGPFFDTSLNQFINVLSQWEELLKNKPLEIMLCVTDEGTIIFK